MNLTRLAALPVTLIISLVAHSGWAQSGPPPGMVNQFDSTTGLVGSSQLTPQELASLAFRIPLPVPPNAPASTDEIAITQLPHHGNFFLRPNRPGLPPQIAGFDGRRHPNERTDDWQRRADSPGSLNRSVHWPRPYSAMLAGKGQSRTSFQGVRIFDKFKDVQLANHVRGDNGYCGEDSDPYGHLGETRQHSRVAGVGFRQPGQPVAVPPMSARIQRGAYLWPGARLLRLNQSR